MKVTTQDEGAHALLTASGELDVETAYDVYLTALSQAQAGFSAVVLDLSEVTFIDSVGLGMLVRARDDLARDRTSQLRLRNPSDRVRRMLELTALLDQFVIDDTDV
ncbi:STAS domain-containing protein [uncultured Jatrophihabitans sp.]|uniref:STAS domain-containing protein n=1 Tax=uncultured Jatrophihabitans sp. TaxID=1610747 RepID=UPI0035CAE83B